MPSEENPEPNLEAPDTVAQSMTSDEKVQVSWLGRFWGVVFIILLAGTIIGLPLWWIWGRSPLLPWLKIFLSLILVLILFLII